MGKRREKNIFIVLKIREFQDQRLGPGKQFIVAIKKFINGEINDDYFD